MLLEGSAVHHQTKYHCHSSTDSCYKDSRSYNRGRLWTAVLRTICDHIHWNQLQRRNIDDQKCTHGIAGNMDPAFSVLAHPLTFLPVDLIKFLERKKTR